ncbi:HIT domain-containing protein [Aquiflexum sp. LQ15W]|uniref:bifunctional class I SAM-dependent methyltransferase/HIT family protein n=1 Tax=Cognataquiflexum nitidum TaxID=2922272 RepID=UPI001F140965|nr:bifunctional class I SAM-dependent methyltransferase/HIT family protein [Cognataquiflexum nitidum]MCH6199116.1 HIT domain-containing protein [Cognataquiflexum nitidum]
MSPSNSFNHLTAKERDSISFPARHVLNKGLLRGEVLDFGCGFGKDVEVLKGKGIDIVGYDRHYFPSYPQKQFDTILCFYVLNVLMQEEQTRVLMEISQLLKPTGKAYFAVRRDVTYEGFRTHKIHQKPTYQCNVILPFVSIFKNESCEIYEYGPFNQKNKDQLEDSCLFCIPSSESILIAESATAFSIYDKFPVSKGHSLIIPKRHVDNYFDLSFREQSACVFMLNYVKEVVQKKYEPDGFNVGINIGKSAGQTVNHVHIHLIPRYVGDVDNPEGGVRGVIPEKKKYL